jgi:hypothetical protein
VLIDRVELLQRVEPKPPAPPLHTITQSRNEIAIIRYNDSKRNYK